MSINDMYSRLPNLIIGFHGCDKSVYDEVIKNREPLEASSNKYDWLGNGIYFWEQNYDRALEWAKQNNKVKEPRVIGAVLDLGNCFNLVESQYNELLKTGYEILKKNYEDAELELPINKGRDEDKKERNLDCAVIQQIHVLVEEIGLTPFDSVRGVFLEGPEVYPGAGFKERTHMQICVVNPNCIKGYFDPLSADANYQIP